MPKTTNRTRGQIQRIQLCERNAHRRADEFALGQHDNDRPETLLLRRVRAAKHQHTRASPATCALEIQPHCPSRRSGPKRQFRATNAMRYVSETSKCCCEPANLLFKGFGVPLRATSQSSAPLTSSQVARALAREFAAAAEFGHAQSTSSLATLPQSSTTRHNTSASQRALFATTSSNTRSRRRR